jgi:hypothetical protein
VEVEPHSGSRHGAEPGPRRPDPEDLELERLCPNREERNLGFGGGGTREEVWGGA